MEDIKTGVDVGFGNHTPPTIDELKEIRLQGDIRAKDIEAEYGMLKIEQLKRELDADRSSPSEDHVMTFAAPIDMDSAQMAMRTLDIWSRKDPGCDMTIILNSPGGEVIPGFALHDYIKEIETRGHQVTIKVIGSAMSMAAAILQAGTKREISKNSWLLIHEVSADLGMGNMSRLEESQKMVKRWQDKVLDILAARSGISRAQIEKKWKNRDWLLSAEEALELGFVDTIA